MIQKLNTFHLKLIAVVLMLCDHIAYMFVSPNTFIYLIMRCIGRLAAPIFWFCFIEGFKHTSNKKRYATRLMTSAIVMMIGNTLFHLLFLLFNVDTVLSATQPNIFLTLTLMFFVISIIDNLKNIGKFKQILCSILIIALIIITGFFAEYSWIAVWSILSLYYIQNDKMKYSLFILGNIVISLLLKNPYQIFMCLSIIFFLCYKNEKPKHSFKWFFYLFYPLHLWLFFIFRVAWSFI